MVERLNHSTISRHIGHGAESVHFLSSSYARHCFHRNRDQISLFQNLLEELLVASWIQIGNRVLWVGEEIELFLTRFSDLDENIAVLCHLHRT